MAICKRCLLHILSNLMLATIIFTTFSLAFQLNTDALNTDYSFLIITLVAIIIKSWADKTLNDTKN